MNIISTSSDENATNGFRPKTPVFFTFGMALNLANTIPYLKHKIYAVKN